MKITKLLFIFLLAITNINIAKANIFAIKNIKVDVTDKSSVRAKQKAINQATKEAFNALLNRITMLSKPNIDKHRFTTNQINTILSNFDILEEQSSDIQYKGIYDFYFDHKKTSAFLKSKDIAFTVVKSSPVLIIPIFYDQASKKYILWEDNNIWKMAWEKYPNDSVLVPIKLPVGDIQDLSMISLDDTINGKVSQIDSLLKRYEAKDIVAVVAKTEEKGLKVYIDRYGLSGVSYKSGIFIDGNNKTFGEVFSIAISKVAYELNKQWKEKTITHPNEEGSINTLININSINDLQKIKKTLAKINTIESFQENVLTIDTVIFNLNYNGNFADLKLALSQQNLKAEKIDDYTCKLRWSNNN